MKGCKKVMRIGKILGAYSLVYFLAFLAKIKHFTVLSSLLFLFLAAFLYVVEKKEEKTTLPLSGIFALGLFGGEGISVLQLSTLPLGRTALGLAFISVISFFIFFIISFPCESRCLNIKIRKCRKKEMFIFLKLVL